TLSILAWLIFAPLQFAGRVAYVIVSGNSMQPLLKNGDLVLLRPDVVYEPGDITAYHYPEIGPILHRVIGKQLDRYILKGDNNAWTDSYQPSNEDMIGKYWVSFPGLGKVFGWLRQPAVMAVLMGVTVLLFGLSFMQTPQTSRKRKINPRFGSAFKRLGSFLANQHGGYLVLFYFLGVISIILGIVSFSQPALRKAADDLPFQQTGSFAYTAPIPPGVYDSNALQTGDAIFPQLTCLVNMDFEYQLQSEAAFSGLGSYQVVAEVSNESGWRRTMALQPPTSFEGAEFQTQMKLDVCAARNMIAQMQELTGVQNNRYALVVKPTVQVSGHLNGRPMNADFAPELMFRVEPEQIYLAGSDLEETDPLKPAEAGLLAGFTTIPNTISLFSLALPVTVGRTLAILALALAGVGLGVRGYTINRAQDSDERMHARLMLGPRVVESDGKLVFSHERVIDLSSVDDLVRLAELLGAIVFYHEEDHFASYFVRDDWVVYRYQKQVAQPMVRTETVPVKDGIRQALEKNELMLYYQPVVSLKNGDTSYLEALLRWQHPVRGLQMPADFLPQAERDGLLPEIDRWVLEHGCAQLNAWRSAGIPLHPLAINISAQQLRQAGFAKMVETILSRSEIPANLLQLEIDKSAMDPNGVMLENIRRLKELGVGITVSLTETSDMRQIVSDFGVSDVKIGRSLTRRMLADQQFGESAHRWFAIAREQLINVVAVGIETSEQYGFFKQNDCQAAQGFFFCPPLPADAVQKHLQEGSLIDLDTGGMGG
ncbi:MAG: signal peptidase I, partial [Anaerolineaceae bacterium]|nr:signal peptidase I [Anaerolineaceae bacterium]